METQLLNIESDNVEQDDKLTFIIIKIKNKKVQKLIQD